MFWLQSELAMCAVVLLPGLALLVRHYGTRLGRASRERRRREGEVAGLAQEIVRGLPIIQTLGGEQHARDRFRRLNADSLRAGIEETAVAPHMEGAPRIAPAVAPALLVAGGAPLVLAGRLTLGAPVGLTFLLPPALKPSE